MSEVPFTSAPFCPDNQTPMKTIQHHFTIQQVSERCGVSKSTLRFWEKKFRGHMLPDRSKGGQRRYSTTDVALIVRIKGLKADGLSLEEIDARLTPARSPEELTHAAAHLDQLADRIASLVKHEVCRFLEAASSPSGVTSGVNAE